ncbi:MAG: nitroreductase, partial [Gammaproteobacteria bacterium]|nr:nitroreductase [Gammaproteobacteria bacterium]
AENERIIGFIYIGTPTLDIPPRPIPEISNYHSTWS